MVGNDSLVHIKFATAKWKMENKNKRKRKNTAFLKIINTMHGDTHDTVSLKL